MLWKPLAPFKRVTHVFQNKLASSQTRHSIKEASCGTVHVGKIEATKTTLGDFHGPWTHV